MTFTNFETTLTLLRNSLPRYYLAIQRSVAIGVILSLLFCTVEDISTQDGAIGVKFWLRVEQTPGTGMR